MEPYKLPYFADSKDLPAPLPTMQQIQESQEILSGQSERKVVGIGDLFVAKFGLGVDLLEGESMLFLLRETKVPIPRVYALFQNPDTGRKYIIMERVLGRPLELEWPLLDHAEKEAITSTLRCCFEEIRKLETPRGYCSVGNRGLPDGIFWTSNQSNPYAGPFETESDLNEAMVGKYLESGISKYKAEFYSRVFKNVLQNHRPVFSHGDLQRKNVLVRKATNIDSKQSVGEIVIIDWEYAGWYPSYWEYSRAVFACGRWSDDWSLWIEKIVDPAMNEYAWIQMLLRELWS